MKAIILAGGKGTRLAEYTSKIPKPMVNINKKPIITYIIDHYIKYGVTEILIAGGYKYNLLKNYFLLNKKKYPNVRVLNTGLNSLTAKRMLKLKKNFKKGENFFMTYGDGVADVDIAKLLKHHEKNKKACTLTAVRPIARFGELKITGNTVNSFNEKPQLKQGWINGGFFVLEPEFFKLIKDDKTYLERAPLEKATQRKQLAAFKHKGFWQCMDTKRDKDRLDKILKDKKNKF